MNRKLKQKLGQGQLFSEPLKMHQSSEHERENQTSDLLLNKKSRGGIEKSFQEHAVLLQIAKSGLLTETEKRKANMEKKMIMGKRRDRVRKMRT